jgi:hypothetical protein
LIGVRIAALGLLCLSAACQQAPSPVPVPQSAPSPDDPRLAAAISWVERGEGRPCSKPQVADLGGRAATSYWPPIEGYQDRGGNDLAADDVAAVDAAARELASNAGGTPPDISRRLICQVVGSTLSPQPSFSGIIELGGVAFTHVETHWGEGWLALRHGEAGWRAVGLASGSNF